MTNAQRDGGGVGELRGAADAMRTAARGSGWVDDTIATNLTAQDQA